MMLSEFNRVQERFPRYFEDYYHFAQSYHQLPSLQKSLEAKLGRALSTTEAQEYINSEATSLYARMKEYGKYQVFNILERTDQEASLRLQRVWKNALEYSHADAVSEAKDILILAKSVRISRDLKNMTCPIKSLAIFVHNRDITYEQHEVLKLFDDCKE